MSVLDLVRRIQRSYPKIWFRCHVEHPGRRCALSQRETTLLHHLADPRTRNPSALAEHLGVAASTLSEGIDPLVERGLVRRDRDPADRRRVHYRLTDEGEAALDEGSPLSTEALSEVLDGLHEDDRRRAVEGLEILATACARSRS